MKDLVAIVEGGTGGLRAAPYALDLAKLRQAHLAMAVVPERPTLNPLDPMGAYYSDAERDAKRADDLSAIRALADRSPVDCDVRSLGEDMIFVPGSVDLRSRCADLVLVGPASCWNDRRLRRHVAEAMLLDTAAPLLLHPEETTAQPFRHAVLGWNQSAEAARTARALRDVVEPGGTIDVVIVEPLHAPDGRSSDAGLEIVEHFARHGFRTQLHACPRGGRSVAEVLESFAVIRKAQLLAVGGYAHSRLRELIVGGVTRDLIEDQSLPILMVH